MKGSMIKSWLVVASIGAVEALKDQGVARWNGPLKALHHHSKIKIVSTYNKCVDDAIATTTRTRRSMVVGSEMTAGKHRSSNKKKTKAECMKKVIDINCFGPNTLR